MKVGAGIALMNALNKPDFEVYQKGLRLSEEVEDLGFDSIWTVEHHFTGHSPVPNSLQMLSYLAARTSHLLLGTAVIVLPWHNPIRVAEEIAVLDILSNGRIILGLGRGASAIEYSGFQVPLEESRERFIEAIQIIKRGLSQSYFSFEGDFFRIPEISIRPRPISNPEQRMYGASASLASAEVMAELGLGLLLSPERCLETSIKQIDSYKEVTQRFGYELLKPICHLYVSIHKNSDEAIKRAIRYMSPMVEALDHHYLFSSKQLVGVKNEYYANSKHSNLLSNNAKNERIHAFIDKHIVGTPEQCIERIVSLREQIGIEHFVGEFSYGDMPVEECQENMRLFANTVLPILHNY